MAIYHLNIRHCSRNKGQSAQAKFDYINRNDKYSKKLDDLQYSKSGNMPSFAQNNPELFWQSVDKFERANARVCTEIEFALPRELTLEQQQELVSSFIEKTINNEQRKLPFSFAIHNDKANNNPHCHLVFSVRQLDGIDRTAEQFFKRANSKNAELGGAKKDREVIQKDFLQSVRKSWSEQANLALEKYGHTARIDERSYQEQGLEQQARPRLDRVTWQELSRLEQENHSLGREIEKLQGNIQAEKRNEKMIAKGVEYMERKIFGSLSENTPKSSIERQNKKSEQSQGESKKTPENAQKAVSQMEFDLFIYKDLKNAERPKFEHERKIQEWEKNLENKKSSYASYKGDLERVESEKWGMLGLYQSKEQKAEIERIKGILSDLSEGFNQVKGYIAEEREKIEQISKQNQPLYDRKAEMLRSNPELVEKPMTQLHSEFMQRATERWEKEQKIKQQNRSLSRDRDDYLSL
ncbi:MobA/MobL family protein [[Haemophilus] felis]|nr:MobA/MobL family protein [[Haemophilus] felis]NBI41831.1 MobA/MobL family protein [[Haemophilus] felis]